MNIGELHTFGSIFWERSSLVARVHDWPGTGCAPAPAIEKLGSAPAIEMSEGARAAVDRGLKYLAEAQKPNGSLGGDDIGADAAIASLAGMAFLAADARFEGGAYSQALNRCQKLVLGQTRADGFIGQKANMYGHAMATRFLIDVQRRHPSDELKGTIEKAVDLCERCQNDAGGWRYLPSKMDGDTSVTACVLSTLAAADRAKIWVTEGALANGGKYLLSCQNADGGFCYTTPGQPSVPARSAAVAAALQAVHADAEKIESALGYLNGAADGLEMRQDWFSGYTYYAFSQALAEQPKLAQPWYAAASRRLIEAQRGDGSWKDQSDTGFNTATACLVLQMPRWALAGAGN